MDGIARAGHVMQRIDALAAISEEPGRLTRRFATPALDVLPGAANVIPGRAVLSLDVRHAGDAVRERACAALRARADAIAAARGLGIVWDILQETPSVALSGPLTSSCEQAIEEVGLPVRRLVSGAGHDAVTFASPAPVALLFVRCTGGISHHPDERAATADTAVALDVLDRCLALAGVELEPAWTSWTS
jgi:allantoate deiminase